MKNQSATSPVQSEVPHGTIPGAPAKPADRESCTGGEAPSGETSAAGQAAVSANDEPEPAAPRNLGEDFARLQAQGGATALAVQASDQASGATTSAASRNDPFNSRDECLCDPDKGQHCCGCTAQVNMIRRRFDRVSASGPTTRQSQPRPPTPPASQPEGEDAGETRSRAPVHADPHHPDSITPALDAATKKVYAAWYRTHDLAPATPAAQVVATICQLLSDSDDSGDDGDDGGSSGKETPARVVSPAALSPRTFAVVPDGAGGADVKAPGFRRHVHMHKPKAAAFVQQPYLAERQQALALGTSKTEPVYETIDDFLEEDASTTVHAPRASTNTTFPDPKPPFPRCSCSDLPCCDTTRFKSGFECKGCEAAMYASIRSFTDDVGAPQAASPLATHRSVQCQTDDVGAVEPQVARASAMHSSVACATPTTAAISGHDGAAAAHSGGGGVNTTRTITITARPKETARSVRFNLKFDARVKGHPCHRHKGSGFRTIVSPECTAAVNMIQARANVAYGVSAPPLFDLREAAANLAQAVPPRLTALKQGEGDQAQLQRDVLSAFGLASSAVEAALTSGDRTAGQNNVIERFTEAMLVAETVARRLECPHIEWRDLSTVAKTTTASPRTNDGQGTRAGAVAAASEQLVLLDSGAGMTCVQAGHLRQRDEGDRIVCQAVNQSLTRSLGSGPVCFVAPGSGEEAAIRVRRAHELPEIECNILSLYDHLDGGGQFHASSLGDVYMLTPGGQRVQCVFKDRVVQFKASIATSE